MSTSIPFLFALALSLFTTSFLIRIGPKIPGFLRKPTSDRWHKLPTPSLGGISMFVAYAFAQLFFFNQHTIEKIDLVFWCSTPAFLMGLLDDLWPLPPYIKLVGQIASACLLLLLDVHVAFNGNPLVYIPLTILWIVMITNAFNLLDNMDGLASGVALIASLSILTIGIISHSAIPSFALLLLIASIAGFFFFNYPPAKIFMGDCGSQWLGFMLAGFTIVDTWTSASNLLLMLITPTLILAVPIFDTILVTFNRKLHGRPVSRGGKDHSSHRFVALGFSEKKTVFVLWGLALVFGLLAVFSQIYQVQTWAVLVGGCAIIIILLGTFLTDVRVYDAPQNLSSQENLTSLLYKRRIAEILFDTAMIGAAYVIAYLVRYDWNLDFFQRDLLSKTLPLVVGIKLLALLGSGLYRGIWMYIDFQGFSKLLRSALLASAATIIGILFIHRFEGFSRTLFFIDFCILLMLMGGSRALLRGLRESVFAFPDQGTRVLILGAGEASRKLLFEIRKNRQWNLTPVAILDDDVRKKRGNVLGIHIVGTLHELESWIDKKSIERVIVAIPSIKPQKRIEIEHRCSSKKIPVVCMPSIEETIIQKLNTAI